MDGGQSQGASLQGDVGRDARQRVERWALSFWAVFGLGRELQAAERRSKQFFRGLRSYKDLTFGNNILCAQSGKQKSRQPHRRRLYYSRILIAILIYNPLRTKLDILLTIETWDSAID